MATAIPFSLPRAESYRRLRGMWAANVAGALLATAVVGFLLPPGESILQGGLIGVGLGVAIIGFVVAFVVGDRMDSLEENR